MASRTVKLIRAASRGDFRRVEELLEEGGDVNGTDQNDSTPLLSTLSTLTFFKKRVINGRILSCRTVPLQNVRRTVRVLLQAGASPNAQDPEYGLTPLLCASADLPLVRMLVEAGADPDVQSGCGLTPLHDAVLCCREDVVRYLLRHGADTGLKDGNGESVLDAAKGALRSGRCNSQIYQMVRSAHAKLAKRKERKAPPQEGAARLGIKDFAAMSGHPEWSFFAAKAPAHVVTKALADFRKPISILRDVAIKTTRVPRRLARLTAVLEIRDNPWTIVLRSIFDISAEELEDVPEEAKFVSSRLKTKVLTCFSEDTSAAMSYALYERGRVVQKAEWECGSAVSLADPVLIREGIYVPACYPCSQGMRVWLAVRGPSAGAVVRAVLLNFGKSATPTFDKATAPVRARM